MATGKENLATALANVRKAIADLTLNPRPNYSLDGRSYSWNELLSSLIENENKLLVAIQAADGPFEVVTRGEG